MLRRTEFIGTEITGVKASAARNVQDYIKIGRFCKSKIIYRLSLDWYSHFGAYACGHHVIGFFVAGCSLDPSEQGSYDLR
jgi:hypothetical protein